jgi:SAM-dependent methyltransferase
MSLDNWSRTPKHILRKECIGDAVKDLLPGYFLELGSGNGDLTKFFIEKGFYGKCYDIGDQTRQILKQIFCGYGNQVIEVIDDLNYLLPKSFDYLFAFEVLEHISDDTYTLLLWSRYLKNGGKLILSVPAHMHSFGVEDAAVGHYRRYEKNNLYQIIKECGYYNIRIYSYGFPLGNLTRKFSILLNQYVTRSKKEEALSSVEQLTMEQKSILSGIERSFLTNRFSFLFKPYLLFPFILIQKIFYHHDLGDGYVVVAEKR